ncbi:DUF3426 domain-containing protein [Stenotrophomonas sp. 364]|uniref:DUF3426 domain-containing protein n=1 Tax=Stenotrophomonas sp. 364 TaxID=2691571 RepID=UPI001315BAD2|nr:DUF3426 domain-containing protein [Stenotrophomonas sp. 364]QHB73937.1 DUF3426 domain-containing protein [Stenotrophomonas sp. 364]
MTEPTPPPPRRPLATFLRASPDDAPRGQPLPDDDAPAAHDAADDALAQALPPDGSVFDPPPGERDDPAYNAGDASQRQPAQAMASADDDIAHAAPRDPVTQHDASIDDSAGVEPPVPLIGASATLAPSFMRLRAARLHTPRWQWGVLAGLVLLLALQIAVADRARLAADAGSRPWIAGLCSVLRCTLPAWQEPAAFSMISRDVRPVPGQPGALQVQASFRNDARWAQAWPALRLSLSDADGRVIGTGVFAPHDYLDRSLDATSVLEPGQSAQIAFRVREPAASTVAFTFEFQ